MCMHTSFCGCDHSGFRDMATFQKRPNFPFGAWTIYSPWSWKNSIDQNQLEKFMQVGIDVKYMHTNFGRRGLSSFGDLQCLFTIVSLGCTIMSCWNLIMRKLLTLENLSL